MTLRKTFGVLLIVSPVVMLLGEMFLVAEIGTVLMCTLATLAAVSAILAGLYLLIGLGG
jgi:hypothetical protein